MSERGAVNGASWFARTSTGTAVGGSTRWGSTAFFGTVATLVGDVNGDGMTDLMVQARLPRRLPPFPSRRLFRLGLAQVGVPFGVMACGKASTASRRP